MPKAFLSHSSAQKLFVEEVATQLKDDCLIDSKSFEEGLESLDEILNALGRTDLFVLFIAEEALESEWVRKEIVTAKRL
ncbi:MAG: toll/interleukin-1 receptor domain-containing protein [Flavobacteriales bacterium]|nr:toll/interleukin-1 receptor domain-containing protein [Flavobacteriales bacterium]